MGLQDKLDELEPREKRLLGVLVAVFAVMVLLLIPVTVSSILSEKRDDNASFHEAIERIYAEREAIAQRRADNAAILEKYEREAPALAGYLSGLAKASDIDIPELKDKAPVPHGKTYEERSTSISLKKVGMFNLTKFMERIAQAPHPINVTRLNIRKRGPDPDTYDVSMTVSSFHRLEKKKPKRATGKSATDESTEDDG